MIGQLTQDIQTGSIDSFGKAINKLNDLIDKLGINLRDYNSELADTVDRFRGDQQKMQDELAKLREQGIKTEDLKVISKKTDFLGINFYSRAIIRDNDIPKEKNLPIEVFLEEKTDFGWEIHPRSLYDLLVRIKNDYPVEKIYITENGCAYNDAPNQENIIDDSKRIKYHSSHLKELKNAINDGVPCDGYFAWSLMDNFEWCEGFSKRFGLIWVDFETLKRTPKNSFYWYKDIIKNNGEGV